MVGLWKNGGGERLSEPFDCGHDNIPLLMNKLTMVMVFFFFFGIGYIKNNCVQNKAN